VSNQYTCSSWIGADLMSRPRRAAWRKHICDVVLGMLANRDAAPPATATAKARRKPAAAAKK